MASIKNTWNICHASICSISFFNSSGDKIGSGTGFKIQESLVTNNHVYHAPGSSHVELRFVEIDGYSTKAVKRITYPDFQNRLQEGLPETSWDYAILRLDDEEFREVPPLILGDSAAIEIGRSIAILGFQFDQNNLSLKQGIVSSKMLRASVKYLQLDASVNQGNSGGPLIDTETNHVVGIVTRKHTGLTDAFDNLIKSFDDNIKVLEASSLGASISIGGINPVEGLRIGQAQMKMTALEIKRSANVGIGYAYELDHINKHFAQQ